MIKHTFIAIVILFSACLMAGAQEEENQLAWPIEIESEEGFVTTLYQPQLESFEANVLEGRMAVTIKPPEKEMIFGAVWFKARMSTDLDKRTVLLEKMSIIKTHFPDIVDEEKAGKFSELLSAEMESWNLEMSLDRILASLNEVENLKQLSDQINNDPPAIYFRTTPALLIMIDGEPILKKDEDSGLEYVVNTPFFIVKDTKKEDYYITDGNFWYTSNEILNGWEATKKPPSKVKKFAEDNIQEQEPDSIAQSYDEAPELIIETKSAELIMVGGEIDYKPIEGTSLLYVANSESDILMDIGSQNHYILIAGRWYHSKSLEDGDWKFSEPEDLPEDFKKIPEDSDIASVRPSIPGTPEAQTALLEQSIPQTATIDRKEAKVEVKYDGDPQFEKIEGTDISYALNTDKTVLLINNIYYCIDDAVWFMSDQAAGPWIVCDARPDEVDDIPPESPVYNVKYAYIYDSTPEVVYVGYLPGYTYSYVYGGVVVYGTGYYYQPWYGYYYYPRPVTWGYGVHYSPYSGWGFSFGISIGWGFHPYRRGYWGARGYNRGYRHGYNRGYSRGYSRGARAGYAAGSRSSNRNVYSNRSSGVKQTANARNDRASNNMNNKARASGKSNNMYADKKGNVYQRDQKGNFDNKSNRQQPSTNQQQQRQSQQTQTRQQPSTNQQQQRQSQQSQSQRSSQQQMERSHQNRSTGTQNYNRSRSSGYSGASRSSGGSRGGGGGRRR
ncbi:MAG: sulfur globule family protein [Bacteroidales bacterium]|nr:sulfur globule family protein [Bacteroidales bacterium]